MLLLLLFQVKFSVLTCSISINDHNYCVSDKRVLILVFTQASIHFAVSGFWFLWAPTIVVLFCTDVLFVLVLSLIFSMNCFIRIWDWSCAMVLIDLLIGTGWRKVCSTVSKLPLSLSIKNAWERWLSMVLWSHSSLTEWGQLDSTLHWCWTRFVYCGLWLPGMLLHISTVPGSCHSVAISVFEPDAEMPDVFLLQAAGGWRISRRELYAA
jgi:hypothetical protein